ncbi:hypothetical protein M8494_26275 [Serratia ureilytica]
MATLLVLLTLSFRGDAQSHSDNGPHAAGLQRGHQAATSDAYGCVKARIKKQAAPRLSALKRFLGAASIL